MNLQTAISFISNHNEQTFQNVALSLFHLHYKSNPVYGAFCKALQIKIESVNSLQQIPFLPVSFFKSHRIILPGYSHQLKFRSSGTSTGETSFHYVAYAELYRQSFFKAFKLYFGNPDEYVMLALLPSYLERPDSSLVYMIQELIGLSGKPENGFFLYEHEQLFALLKQLLLNKKKTILWGVSFALLDFVEKYSVSFPELIVIETGGMKGRRKEIIRQELHHLLKLGFGVNQVFSEYGMTELLSQAYSTKEGKFTCPPWMKVLIRDKNDPLSVTPDGQTGGINIIDLANAFSCPFIATDDLGRKHPDGTFEVLGRLDATDIRGCNTMIG